MLECWWTFQLLSWKKMQRARTDILVFKELGPEAYFLATTQHYREGLFKNKNKGEHFELGMLWGGGESCPLPSFLALKWHCFTLHRPAPMEKYVFSTISLSIGFLKLFMLHVNVMLHVNLQHVEFPYRKCSWAKLDSGKIYRLRHITVYSLTS